MGSLTSKPKSLPVPQIYYPPAPTSAPATPVTPAPTPEEMAAEQRRKNLLGRDRGRFGTVQTGFRGLLDLVSFGQDKSKRKTLLGE